MLFPRAAEREHRRRALTANLNDLNGSTANLNDARRQERCERNRFGARRRARKKQRPNERQAGKKSIGLVVVTGATSFASKRNSITRCTSFCSRSGSPSSDETTSHAVTVPSGAIVSRSTTLPSSDGFSLSARL